jgi:Cu+-exporting ATPase
MEHKHHPPTTTANGESSLAKDPVCGMSVDPATAKHKAEHAGATYYFCSAGCREKFAADPARFLNQVRAPGSHAHAAHGHSHAASAVEAVAGPAPSGAIYTCPMHPQIRQDHPGNCPICGMTLEPETPSEAAGPSAELVDMTRRLWIALALSVPVFALAMGGHLAALDALLPESLSNWIQLALATPVVLWAGWPFFERGWASLRNRSLNMFTLIAMGVGVA